MSDMTREEITNSRAYQVSKADLEYYNEHHHDKDIDLTDAFEEGAKWADETMIEKACKWLLHQEEMIGISFENDFIERFKKAMEL